MSSIFFKHKNWVLWWWHDKLRIPKINKTKSNKERNECLRRLKIKQLRCNCHCPAVRVSAPRVCSPLIASLSRRCPRASGLMAGGMCSLIASCKNCHKIFQRKSNVALHLDSLEASLINALFSKRLPNVYNVLNNCQLSTSYQLMENIASIASIASVILYFSLTDGLCKGKGSTI